MSRKDLRKITFRYEPETCPTVDSWFDWLIDELVAHFGDEDAEVITSMVDDARTRVKADGTVKLREAMIDMAEHMQDLERRLEEATSGD